jgi:ferritin-like metal-binding protein YciE
MSTLSEQLTNYLTDAHGIEQQALVQMRAAPAIAGDPRLAQAFEAHIPETEEHERLVRARLEAHGAAPSQLKEAVMKAGGAAFVLFARSQPDTPGKLTAHAYSYEHLEYAAYELLAGVAERAGDAETVAVAHRIRDQEQAMSDRLGHLFDVAVEASLRELDPDDLREQLVKYLADAHAIEEQSVNLLQRGEQLAGARSLGELYREHLDETREHQRLLEQRLEALGGRPSALKDAAMRLGALNWALFFQAQPDTPGKLAAFAYAFEHLEIGGYEELWRVARRAGDEQTVTTVDTILAQEHAAAERIEASFAMALEASLAAVGALAR